VKTLLLGGANPALRTRSGALPYHLSGLAVVKAMLKDMGGPNAVPDDGDEIDMVKVLQELTLPDIGYGDGDDYGDEGDDDEVLLGSNTKFRTDNDVKSEEKLITPKKSPKSGGARQKYSPSESKESPLLHSGAVLGDLPALGSGGKSSKNLHEAVESALDGDSFGLAGVNRELLLKKNRMKKRRVKSRNKQEQAAARGGTALEIPADYPEEFLCELTMKPLSDAVESVYGNYFEKSAILSWMKEQGHVCPITGGPLAESDLKPADELRMKITKWILQRSMEQDTVSSSTIMTINTATVTSPTSAEDTGAKATPTKKEVDDLYDF